MKLFHERPSPILFFEPLQRTSRSKSVLPGQTSGAGGATAVLALAFLLSPTRVPAAVAAVQSPDMYATAVSQLDAGDTTAALRTLRELTSEQDEDARAWGLLGAILAGRATTDPFEFEDRREAERALRRALDLDHNNPVYLAALGQVMRKQQMYPNSYRTVGLAEEKIETWDRSALRGADVANLYYQVALIDEDAYLDARNLVRIEGLPIFTDPGCGGQFCLNWDHPNSFNDYFRHAVDLSADAQDDYRAMVSSFRKALAADPGHALAFRRLTVQLIDREDYAEAVRVIRSFEASRPDSPWGPLLMALLYVRTGYDSLAAASFDRALDLSDGPFRQHFENVAPLLREDQAKRYQEADPRSRVALEDYVWRVFEPLYITTTNEARVNYLARLLFADIYFEDPTTSRWGSETERGIVYLRHGPPERVWQVARDQKEGGGRWIFWNYGWDSPNYIFEKRQRWRSAKHAMSSTSMAMQEESRALAAPVLGASFEISDIPTAVARFKGASDSIVDLDIFAEIPGDELLSHSDSMELALFLFHGARHTLVLERRLTRMMPAVPQAFTISLPLLEGDYTFSLEARSPENRFAAERRDAPVKTFPGDQLALSDILLAHQVSPLVEHPAGRSEFTIEVSRDGSFVEGSQLSMYWEVYGLGSDEESVAEYQVRLTVSDAKDAGVATKVFRAFGFGDERKLRLEYERTVALSGDRVPEFLNVELTDVEPGEYQVRLDIHDTANDARTSGETRIRIVGSAATEPSANRDLD